MTNQQAEADIDFSSPPQVDKTTRPPKQVIKIGILGRLCSAPLLT